MDASNVLIMKEIIEDENYVYKYINRLENMFSSFNKKRNKRESEIM